MTDSLIDPFTVAGMEPKFSLSQQELDKRQQGLNRALHPDRHAAGSAAERRAALSRAVDINQAIRSLRDPVQRADALLRRLTPDKATRSPGTGTTKATDPELLMEMMEGRQELQAARSKNNRSAIERLAESLAVRQHVVSSKLASWLDPPATPTKSEIEQATRAVDELRYLARFASEIEATLDDFE